MKRDQTEPRPCAHEDGLCLLPGGWVYDRKANVWRAASPDDTKQRKCWAHGPGLERPDLTRRRRKPSPNARAQVSAAILLAEAREITVALEWINDELSVLGFPGSSTEPYVSGGDTKSGPESDAIAIAMLTADREDLRDALTDVERSVMRLRGVRQRITGRPSADGEPLCRDKQKGREGAIEWGDPTCTELPSVRGLCPKEYHAERRWRAAHGLPGREEAGDAVPAA